MKSYKPTNLPPNFDFESKTILKKLADARSALGELKGYVQTIPNENILLNSIGLQEAKYSSAIENIITTHDDLFKAELDQNLIRNIATKEVQNYNIGLQKGFEIVKTEKLIRSNCILEIQETIEKNSSGYRKLSGTILLNEQTGETVYTPPQETDEILGLMSDLINYINEDNRHDIDPLIKMAIIHFQFESIHPFYDGNGRTGRILNILYLINKGLLDLPVLYLSRFIIQNKNDYYRLLQSVRDENDWENWILFMLEGVQATASDTIELIKDIKAIMQEYKNFLRDNFTFYSQDLLNNLFKHPYTKIDFVKDDLGISRQTASKYLHELAKHESGLIKHVQIGKFSYFINVKLLELFSHKRDVMLKKS